MVFTPLVVEKIKIVTCLFFQTNVLKIVMSVQTDPPKSLVRRISTLIVKINISYAKLLELKIVHGMLFQVHLAKWPIFLRIFFSLDFNFFSRTNSGRNLFLASLLFRLLKVGRIFWIRISLFLFHDQ